ncbi:MAG: acetylxylan esterase [Chthoniobacteraceae bacterium]
MKIPAISLLLAVSTFAAEFPSPEKLPSVPALPDPLVMSDGTRVATKDGWLTRRAPELRELFQHYMYGTRPQPRAVTSKLIREDKVALGGKATLRELLVDCGLGAPVHLMIVIPNTRAKAVPCFLGMNFHGNYQLLDDPKIQMPQGWVGDKFPGAEPNRAADAGRGKEKDTWALEQSVDRGYAVATFFSGDVVPDDKALAEAALKRLRASGSEERGPSDTATIMAWSWGFSRMLDCLLTVPEIDGKRIAVVGHSRNGKTALVAGAFDERIALVIPSQAGCGGSAPDRVAPELSAPQANGRPTVETIAVINKSFPHWFSGTFKEFGDAPARLPFDQHALIALCAPRPVLLSNATEDKWANPPGQFEMLRAADAVYRIVAGDGLGSDKMPEVGVLLNSRLGYFIREGNHSMTTPDWKVWLDFADKWLK